MNIHSARHPKVKKWKELYAGDDRNGEYFVTDSLRMLKGAVERIGQLCDSVCKDNGYRFLEGASYRDDEGARHTSDRDVCSPDDGVHDIFPFRILPPVLYRIREGAHSSAFGEERV